MWLVLEKPIFLWRLTRVRFIEMDGKFYDARERLKQFNAPKRYQALTGAYDAKLASIAYAANVTFEGLDLHPPDAMLELISQLQTQRWYWAPTTNNERFASRYVDYVEAAILGEGEKREAIAGQLRGLPASRLFKNVLVVV